MFIKNINQLSGSQLPFKLNLSEGGILYGKAQIKNDGSGFIKLYDGPVLPAVFLSDNNIEINNYTRFEIKNLNNGTITLKPIFSTLEAADENSIDSILKDLSIPRNPGRDIISSLIKFNVPATHENIMRIYRNLKFLNELKKANDTLILNLIQDSLKGNTSLPMERINDIVSVLKNIDSDFLSFLIQNNIPENLDNILKTNEFLKSFQSFNDLIDFLFKNIKENRIKQNFITHPSIDEFLKNYSAKHKMSFASLSNAVESIRKNPEAIDTFPSELLGKLLDNSDVMKHLEANYNIYFFNLYDEKSLFKNNIIIKNKYRNSRTVDINNIRLFISVETPALGCVEGYIIKRVNNISVLLKTDSKHTPLFESRLYLLENSLKRLGYDRIALSVEKLKDKVNLIGLGEFFNDFTYKELNVKV